MNQNELYHHGVLGMRWGHRNPSSTRTTKSFNTKHRHTMTDTNDKLIGESKPNKVTNIRNPSKAIKVGSSVVAGLLAGSFGSAAVHSLSKSETMARVLVPPLAVAGGMTYYDWINSL